MQETQVRSMGREDPLEKEIATHSITHYYITKYKIDKQLGPNI